MFDTFFKGIFDTAITTGISPDKFLLCIGTGLALGLILALVYRYNTRYTKSFLVTLTLIPATVCAVIMMVNGNIGAGVAVAGAFSLIRFRSVPGTAKEIVAVFIAMAAGLLCGMGYCTSPVKTDNRKKQPPMVELKHYHRRFCYAKEIYIYQRF